MNSSTQLKEEKLKVQTELDQIKDRRIEATLSGKGFNESGQIASLSERLSILDEAIVVAEKRETEQRELERQQEDQRNRQAKKDAANALAIRGNAQIKKTEAAAIALVNELSELTRIFDERSATQRSVYGTVDEINIDNDEIAISDLMQRLFGTIYRPNDSNRRSYGQFHWGVVGVQNWSDVFEPKFNNWAAGVTNWLDREDTEASEADDDE